jgi:large subunit ribosomal protein L25
MAKQYKLTVEKREATGRKDLRGLRKDFKIPGVYYSYEGSNILFQIAKNEIKSAIQSGANIFTVNVGGNEQNVIFKSVQYHPVTEEIIHIDLYGVDMTKSISIKIPLTYTGTPTGVTAEGGVLITNLNEIEISCLPSDIPDNIEVDISDVSLGENIQAGDIDMGDKFDLVTMSDTALMSVTHAAVEAEPEEEDVEGEEGEEGTDSSDSPDGDQSSDSGNEEGSDS